MATNQAKQVKKPGAGRNGNVPPKERQFGQPNGNPRNPGNWKKEDTPRYKLEQMLKLNQVELLKIANDLEAPYFERRIAKSLLKEERWTTTSDIINQIQGYPKQSVEATNIELKSILPKPTEDKGEAKKGSKSAK